MAPAVPQREMGTAQNAGWHEGMTFFAPGLPALLLLSEKQVFREPEQEVISGKIAGGKGGWPQQTTWPFHS